MYQCQKEGCCRPAGFFPSGIKTTAFMHFYIKASSFVVVISSSRTGVFRQTLLAISPANILGTGPPLRSFDESQGSIREEYVIR